MAAAPAASRPRPSMNEDGVMISQEQYAKLPRFYQAAALKPRADVVVRVGVICASYIDG